MIRSTATGLLAFGTLAFGTMTYSDSASADPAYDALIAKHAAANGVPESLVRRVIIRESRFRPGVVSKGNYGLMQIKPATARSMGYTGSPSGLLDADTNMTYAVKYLAGAYKAAGGNHDRAVSYYASGYYYAAKRQRGRVMQAETAPQANIFQAASAPETASANAPASDTNAAAASSAASKPIVLRPDSMTAFAQTEPQTPRKTRRQRKAEKPLNLLDIFTPKTVDKR